MTPALCETVRLGRSGARYARGAIRPDIHARFLRIIKRVEANEAHMKKTVLKPTRQEAAQWKGTPSRRTRGKLDFLERYLPDVNDW